MKMIKMMNHDNQVKTAGGTSHLRQVANPSAILPSEVTIGITYNDPFFQLSCEATMPRSQLALVYHVLRIICNKALRIYWQSHSIF
jgi:hypothetical protein